MAGTVVAAVVVSAIVSFTTASVYESTTQLTFVRQPDIAAALSGSMSIVSVTEVQLQAQTYAELMTSDEMRGRAEDELGRSILQDVEVRAEYVPDTSVLRIITRSGEPGEAQAVANAYATGFTAWRRQVAVEQYKQAERIIQERIQRYGKNPDRFSDPAYVQLVGRLQDMRLLKASATGNFVVAAAGELPTAPVLPRHTRDLVLGLLIGLVLGIGAVTLLEQLDVRVHSVEDLGELLSLPVLARLPRPSRDEGRDNVLAVASDPSGPTAEAFRMFRSNLDFVAVDGALDSILFTSAQQEEGKTTTAGNLALMLARAGKRVIVVDCDLRRPRMHTYFGLPNKAGVSTLLTGRGAVADTLQKVAVPTAGEVDAGVDKVEGREWIAVLTAGPVPPNPGEIVASHRLHDLLTELSGQCDLLLVDCPPFLAVGDAAALARAVTGVIIVSRMGVATRALAQETRSFVERLPCRTLGVAVTRVATEGTAYRYRSTSEHGTRADGVTETPETPEPLVTA